MADQKGLAGVTAADTSISYIDGEAGLLYYRGYDVRPLAEKGSFAEALYLLWYGDLPTRVQLLAFEGLLAAQRELPEGFGEALRTFAPSSRPMDALRTAVSLLGQVDEDGPDVSPEADLRKAGRIVACLPTVVAAFHRLRSGLEPIEPDPNLGAAEDFLRMMSGERPDPTAAKALDTTLLLYLEHGLNASTFTCRVIASTLADMHAALAGGVAALGGPLHGGANEGAMRMLAAIGSPDNVANYLDAELAAGRKIMGFGHRVYRTEDPRAAHLREMSGRLGTSSGDPTWSDLSMEIERQMLERKGLYSNVDFFCASVYRYLDIPLDLFTPLFALGRSGGWAAHVMEQHRDNRLIRPRANYVGVENRPYVLLEHRD